DFLFLTVSSHGSQVKDENGDEPDGYDETWRFFDGEIVDDEVFGLLSQFAAGVRIFVLSDSCHSGTIISVPPALVAAARLSTGPQVRPAPRFQSKQIPPADQARYVKEHAVELRGIQETFKLGRNVPIKASVLLISACQDGQVALDGEPHGVFT